jgi:sulfite exporter TauE/SafE
MAASAGLLSTLHCLGMCGGIVAALALGAPAARRDGRASLGLACAYNGARISSYALLGALAALVTLPAGAAPWAYRGLQAIGLVMLVLAGLRLGGWLGGTGWLERMGLRLWRRMSPLTRRFLPIDRVARAVPAGLLWGFLPCGLVYAMLPVAASTGSPSRAALTMAAFGAGTLPGMLLASTLADRLGGLRPAGGLRRYAGATLVLLACVWFGLQWLGSGHDHPAHAPTADGAGSRAAHGRMPPADPHAAHRADASGHAGHAGMDHADPEAPATGGVSR